jgi:hypothetical protein
MNHETEDYDRRHFVVQGGCPLFTPFGEWDIARTMRFEWQRVTSGPGFSPALAIELLATA